MTCLMISERCFITVFGLKLCFLCIVNGAVRVLVWAPAAFIGGDGPMANTTTPKDETLDPIRHCTIPQSVTQLKAFLGLTQQMAYYVPYYALVATPLHRLNP